VYTETNGILAGNLPIEILGQGENGKVRRAALDFDGTISFIHVRWLAERDFIRCRNKKQHLWHECQQT